MMRKLLTFLIALAAIVFGACSPVSAQVGGLMFPGPGPLHVSGGSYTGPGDVVSGASAYYGLRAYSSATRGGLVANLCNSTGGVDVTCADASSDAVTGNLVIPGSLVSFCPGANCTVAKLYEQTGAACTGGIAVCDSANTAVASRPILTASCTGSRPCMTLVRASSQQLTAGAGVVYTTSISQPFTVSTVAIRTASTTSINGICTFQGPSGARQMAFDTTTRIYIFPGSSNVNSGTVTNSAYHAVQGVFTTNSLVYIDGTGGTPASGGTSTTTAPPFIGSDSFGDNLDGQVTECGLWPIAFSSGQASSMRSNQHTYWGF
jgi:hypothetical protein